jgi:integrase
VRLAPLRVAAISETRREVTASYVNSPSIVHDPANERGRSITLVPNGDLHLRALRHCARRVAPRRDVVRGLRTRRRHGSRRAAGGARATEQRGPYCLRHTFATEALAAGISTFELSRVTGTSLAMIDRHYGHLARNSEDAIRDAINARSARSGVFLGTCSARACATRLRASVRCARRSIGAISC